MQDKEKKEPKEMWIRVLETCVTDGHVFVGGQVYQSTDFQIAAIQKQLDARRKKLPKDHRGTVKNLKYEVTVAPWQAAVDPDRQLLEDLIGQLDQAQLALEKARFDQDDLMTRKAEIDKLLAGYMKLDTKELEASGTLNRLYRKAKANMEIVECDLEQTVDDIKEYNGTILQLRRMIEAQQTVIAKKKQPAVEESDNEDGETKTVPSDQSEESVNPEGQAAPSGQEN